MIARRVIFSLLVAAVTWILPLSLHAQTDATAPPLPESGQIEGVTLTTADVHQFLGAMHQALQPNDMTVPILVQAKRSSEMPAYDMDAHYVGIQEQTGKKVMVIWVNADRLKHINDDAMIGAFALAVSDGGYGGPAFKKLYDIYAEQDAQLPTDAPDPYLNRHKFANAMVRSINDARSAPSVSPSP